MGRAPCCDKVGLKRGPWTQDEDTVLTSYIHQHGHGNWRALPKQAGLLRCGKSCRLRWTNYLRPDIKRGNFSKEEEDTVIQLHQVLGNRWSAIAGKLPGRTDNEIKNVWHTHLKKRVQNHQTSRISKGHSTGKPNCDHSDSPTQSESVKTECATQPEVNSPKGPLVSPQRSSSELSSLTEVRDTFSISISIVEDELVDISSEAFLNIDESFWADAFSIDGSSTQSDIPGKPQFGFPLSPLTTPRVENVDSTIDEGMDFWYDVYMKAEELPEF